MTKYVKNPKMSKNLENPNVQIAQKKYENPTYYVVHNPKTKKVR